MELLEILSSSTLIIWDYLTGRMKHLLKYAKLKYEKYKIIQDNYMKGKIIL